MKLLLPLLAVLLAAPLRAEPAASGTNETETAWTGTAVNSEGKTIAKISVDTSQAADLAAWGKHAGELCVEWYPKIAALLASDGFIPPDNVKLRFRDGRGVAATGGNVITINAKFVRSNTNDWGMVIHELTHVIQSYPGGRNPGWVVEGVADYIRLTHFEPQARRPRPNPEKASYQDAYKTTAIFFEWVEKTHDAQLIKKLNRVAREGSFQIELFKEYTGRTIDELWQEYLASLSPGPNSSSGSNTPVRPASKE